MSELDRSQLDACRTGDAGAWRGLVERFAPLAIAIGRRYRLQESECEDVAQHTFSALWSNLDRIRDAAALPGWIATTARRESVRIARATRKQAGGQGVDLLAIEAQGTADLELHASIRRALGELGGRCQALLEMLYVRPHKPDYEAISAHFGIPVGSIGPTRQRCLAKLADILGVSRGD